MNEKILNLEKQLNEKINMIENKLNEKNNKSYKKEISDIILDYINDHDIDCNFRESNKSYYDYDYSNPKLLCYNRFDRPSEIINNFLSDLVCNEHIIYMKKTNREKGECGDHKLDSICIISNMGKILFLLCSYKPKRIINLEKYDNTKRSHEGIERVIYKNFNINPDDKKLTTIITKFMNDIYTNEFVKANNVYKNIKKVISSIEKK